MQSTKLQFNHFAKGLMLSAMSILLVGCGSQAAETVDAKKEAVAKPAAPQRPLPMVSVLPAHLQTIPDEAQIMGRVVAKNIAEIRPQVTGLILKKQFEEGAKVEKDQVLYQIDSDSYQAAYDSALASVSSAKSTLENAKLTVQRNKRIVKINAISEQDVDNAVAAENTAQAQVLVSEAALKTAEINLQRTQIRSPMTGIIGRSFITPGALVTANQAQALAVVQDLNTVYVDFAVSSTIALKLKQALTAGQTLPKIFIYLNNQSKASESGKITVLEQSVNPENDTVVIRAEFTNPQQMLLPGYFVKGKVAIGEKTQVVLLPPQALSRNSTGDAMVMVVNGEGKVAVKPIVEQGLYEGQWVVSAGLEEGEQVIIKGLQYIRPGMPVQVAAPKAAPGASS